VDEMTATYPVARRERVAWLAAIPLAVAMLFLSNDYEVTTETYWCGASLFLLTGYVVWLRFRGRPVEKPLATKFFESFVLAIVCGVFLLYLMGVATWFK
jgi:hypothetical protein